jgi:GH25 family lysozyme M1 (1,4-beta-N-acetylmuramidase)
VLGVISRWQDDNNTPTRPDLAIAKERGIKGVIIQAGHGVSDFDPDFHAMATSAIAAELPWSAGWWPEPNEGTPEEQADIFWYIACSVGAAPTLPLSLDIEGVNTGTVPPPNVYAPWLRRFVDRLTSHAGRSPHIYTADWWWNGRVAKAGISFADCDLRVPEWPYDPVVPPRDPREWAATVEGFQPDPVAGFPTWGAWQFSCDGDGRYYGMESPRVCVNVVKPEVWDRWTVRL